MKQPIVRIGIYASHVGGRVVLGRGAITDQLSLKPVNKPGVTPKISLSIPLIILNVMYRCMAIDRLVIAMSWRCTINSTVHMHIDMTL